MTENATSTEPVSTDSDSKPGNHLRLVPPPSTSIERKSAGIRRLTAAPLCQDLEWLLTCGASAMGEHGTTGSVISQIERGSVGGGSYLDGAGSYRHPYTDTQLALGSKTGIGDVERHRWLTAAWQELTPEMRGVLTIRYSAPRAQFRSDSGYGAKDRWVEGSDARPGSHQSQRTGVESLLGEFAALCFALCSDAAKLLLACQEADPQLKQKDGTAVVNKDGTVKINRGLQAERRCLRNAVLGLARAADTAAHAAWAKAKASVASARTLMERIGIRPAKTIAAPTVLTGEGKIGAVGAPTPRRRDLTNVDDVSFGEAVRMALLESGVDLTPGRRARPLKLADAGGGESPARASGGSDLLGLLSAHADEAL